MYKPQKKTIYQNLKLVNDITEKRLQLDTEFLKLGKELEDKKFLEETTKIVDKQFDKQLQTFEASKVNKVEEEDTKDNLKEYILYVDESQKSLECLTELKKNVDLKLVCYICKKGGEEKIPTFIQNFPYLIDKQTKKGYDLQKCIDFIKSKKICKLSYTKNKSGKTLGKW